MTAVVISNKAVDDIMKTIKSLEEPGLLVESTSEKIKNERKEQKGRFLLGILLGILAAILLGNMFADKAKIPGREVTRAGEGTIRASQNF